MPIDFDPKPGLKASRGNYSWRSTIKQQDARAVIDALEKGRVFEFHSYAADARETLKQDVAAGCFVLTRQNAYQPDEEERRTFTRDELLLELEASFSYSSFGLPPAQGRTTTRKAITSNEKSANRRKGNGTN